MCMQAHRQVVECRRILKWTYAYGYYKFDPVALEPGENATDQEKEELEKKQEVLSNQKAFFEFQQVSSMC